MLQLERSPSKWIQRLIEDCKQSTSPSSIATTLIRKNKLAYVTAHVISPSSDSHDNNNDDDYYNNRNNNYNNNNNNGVKQSHGPFIDDELSTISRVRGRTTTINRSHKQAQDGKIVISSSSAVISNKQTKDNDYEHQDYNLDHDDNIDNNMQEHDD